MVSLLLDTSAIVDALLRRRGFSLDDLANFVGRENRLFTVPQNVAELWNVMTRPASGNGFGMEPGEVAKEIRRILKAFPPVADPPETAERLVEFAARHQVRGRQIHDARLALLVGLHSLDGILTSNGPDFARYGLRIFTAADLPYLGG